MFFTGSRSEKTMRLLPYLMPARRLVGKNKLTDIDHLTRCRKFFINDSTVIFFLLRLHFWTASSLFLFMSYIMFTIEWKSGRLGQFRALLRKSVFLSIDFFLWGYFRLMFSSHWNCDILYQFSKVWRLSNCVFFIRRTSRDLINELNVVRCSKLWTGLSN